MNGGKVIDKCLGNGFDEEHKKFHKGGACKRIVDGLCAAYIKPEMKWDRGPTLSYCPSATHYLEFKCDEQKQRAGQQKGKKGKRNR
jgi:hypothetical protein